jgi:hypothetical protein
MLMDVGGWITPWQKLGRGEIIHFFWNMFK